MDNVDFEMLQRSLTPKPTPWWWNSESSDRELFVQIFEFPTYTSGEYCFTGGNAVVFRQVNWINHSASDVGYVDLKKGFQLQLDANKLLKKDKKYLIILSNGDCFIFPEMKKI